MRKAIFISIIAILCLANPVSAFWVWTPKTGKWTNPKTAGKITPTDQLSHAVGLYEQGKLKHARGEFKKLLKNYPKSEEAAEAQYYLGVILEDSDKLYPAYLAYQKVIDKYPFSSRINEIIEKEFHIAEQFMQGKKRKTLGMNLPVENSAIEIFHKVVENSNYGPLAAEAQYKLGLLLKNSSRFMEAEDEFDKVIKNYPQSEWVASAQFQIASCRSRISSGPDYERESTREAKEGFEKFVGDHPDVELAKRAEKHIVELKEREAQGHYDTAVFYEKQMEYKAAKIYYNIVVNDYPASGWVDLARSKLEVLESIKEDDKES